MKAKLKKQRRRLIWRIFAVLFSVWLVVSCAYSGIILKTNNDKLINSAELAFWNLSESISTYSYLDIYLQKENFSYYSSSDGKSEHNPSDRFSTDIHITLKYSDTPQKALVDTDKDIFLQFTALVGESALTTGYGRLNFDEFKASMSLKDYETICEYLQKAPDKDGYYYELLCREFYVSEDADLLIPKTVELVRSHQSHTWYAEDEVILTCNLTPNCAENLTLYKAGRDHRNLIPDQFVLNKFGSSNLLKYALETEDGESLADNFAYGYAHTGVKHTNPFRCVFYGITIIPLELQLTLDETPTNTEIYAYYHQDKSAYQLCFAKQIDVLEYSFNSLIAGISVIFLFFAVIGIILTLMLWKVLKTQMEEGEKRRELTNALAHDIKTPLFIIEGFAQNLKENIHTEKREHYADKIIEKTTQANSIIHRMLDFAQIESENISLKKEKVNINELIKSIASDYAQLNRDRLKITSEKDCVIFADRECMQRVITNLVDNAMKYSDKDTVISIEIEAEGFSISNICTNLANYDTKKLTNPYFRMDKSRNSEGSGLGLATVKAITDMHGYKLSLKVQENLFTASICFTK